MGGQDSCSSKPWEVYYALIHLLTIFDLHFKYELEIGWEFIK